MDVASEAISLRKWRNSAEEWRPKSFRFLALFVLSASCCSLNFVGFVGVKRPSRPSLIAARVSWQGADRSNEAMRYEHDNSAKWDPKNRMKTKSPEEAERILRITGRLPRPLRLSDVKLGAPPLRKTIVATAKERRSAAEMAGIYSVSRLQARLLLHREHHPVWGYERVMIYGNMISEYMVPDTFTNDPMEVSVPLKFKAAFREDADPYHPTGEAAWNAEMERQGLKSEIAEGRVFEELLRKYNDPKVDVPENMFTEAILDNVVDLGELVLQFYGLYMDRQPVDPNNNHQKLGRRLKKRMKKDYGLDSTFDMKDELPSQEDKPTAQEIHDYAGSLNAFNQLIMIK